ncbi:DNA mismatch repair protein MSH6 [Nematocida displodere]|uniref:DNA mismatch repair protein MSH6 n=1 Tax=Nematocida displodere TaxID=1805483 RepID=A0A177EHQ4_9MICR|nr:DNA mismatch repair protein MSH6 [Nematocida displodere]
MVAEVRKGSILSWAAKKTKTEETSQELSQQDTGLGASIGLGADVSDLEPELTQEQPRGLVREQAQPRGLVRDLSQAQPQDLAQPRLSFLDPPVDMMGRTPEDSEYDCTTLTISQTELSQMTPCEAQFWKIKMEYFDTVVFFKKGKFYELFEDDAALSSELFGLKLTKRGSMRMAGVPEMSLDFWVARFVARGLKVAVVDQKESSVAQNLKIKLGEAKKEVIERELKEVITAVTNSQDGISMCALTIEAGEHPETVRATIALFRPMESEFFVHSVEDTTELFKIQTIIKKENVKEILTDKRVPINEKITKIRKDGWNKNSEALFAKIDEDTLTAVQRSTLGTLFSYLLYLKHQFTPKLVQYTAQTHRTMYIDGKTIETLGLVDRAGTHSVLAQIDRTKTKLGKRLLRQWILQPLSGLEDIEARYNTTLALEESVHRRQLEDSLQTIGDLNDFTKKGKNGNLKAHEIRKLVQSLKSAAFIHRTLTNLKPIPNPKTLIPNIITNLIPCQIHTELIAGFDIAGEVMPLSTNRELIAAGQARDAVVAALEAYARKESHAAKVAFTLKKIGREHSMEIAGSAPLSMRFTMVGQTKNTTRYTTPELRRLSEDFLEAEEKITVLGETSLLRISARVAEKEEELRSLALGIAELDCLLSFAEISGALPTFAPELAVKGLTNLKKTHIPNDITIDQTQKLLVVTGPNMAGKSTFLRNVSVAVILRQIGVRVPATTFSAPIYDRVFTRIGANDNFIDGESTFQVEMKETSQILSQATERSFVIIDELGRGTSTKEGSAIAMAVKEHLKHINCTTLYSTHFFGAIVPSDRVVKMDYKHVTSSNNVEEIVYLYKIVNGICNDSCGIDICKIAKIPKSIVDRAVALKALRIASSAQ